MVKVHLRHLSCVNFSAKVLTFEQHSAGCQRELLDSQSDDRTPLFIFVVPHEVGIGLLENVGSKVAFRIRTDYVPYSHFIRE